MRNEKPESYSRPNRSSKTEPFGKQTMASRLDSVIVIPVRVATPDNRYSPQYTFTKPSTAFMYYYYQLQYFN